MVSFLPSWLTRAASGEHLFVAPNRAFILTFEAARTTFAWSSATNSQPRLLPDGPGPRLNVNTTWPVLAAVDL